MRPALMLAPATALLAVGGGSAAALRASSVPSAHAPLAAPSSSVLTFVTWRSGVQMIASRGVDGGPLREITAGDQPRWSPDGRRLLYVVHPNGRSDLSVLHVVDRDGRHAHVVATGTAPSWSPDGTKIVLRDPAGRVAIASVASGRVLRRLPQPAGVLSFGPVWSPDGRWIAVVRARPLGASSLLLARPDGRGLRRVAADVSIPWGSWSPDGGRLAFTTTDHSAFVFTLRTGRLHRLPSIGSPLWSPDGRLLAGAAPDAHTLTLVRPDGTQLQTISTPAVYELVWSRDSQSLAGSSSTPGSPPDVWVVGINGSSRPVSEGERYGYGSGAPAWAPPGAAHLGRVVSPAMPTDSRVEGDTLLSRWSVTGLAADGGRVAVFLDVTRGGVPGCTDVWTVGVPAAARLPSGCVARRSDTGVSPSSGALGGDRLWVQSSNHVMGTNMYSVGLSTLEHPARLTVDGVCPNGVCIRSPIGDLVADGTLTVFDSWTGPEWYCTVVPCPLPKKNGTLYRIDGTQAVVIASTDDGRELTPLAVDGGRILVNRGLGGLSVYDRDGARLLTLPLTNIDEGALAGDDLIAHAPPGLRIFDSRTGTERRTCALPDGTRLDGAADGLAAVTTPNATRIVRLADCRTVTIAAAPPRPDLARITSAGLFYVQRTGDPTYPHRVEFAPREALLQALGTRN